MIIKYHEPYGKINQDKLPEDWKFYSLISQNEPEKLRCIEPFKLFASAVVWEHHIYHLYIEYGISNFIQLTEGNWLNAYDSDTKIIIHQYPFYESNELTYQRIKRIVATIRNNPETFLVFSLNGTSKPAKITTAYIAKHKTQSYLKTLIENTIRGYLDPVTTTKIWNYFKKS